MTGRSAASPRDTLMTRFGGSIEKVGNALPHPATLFAILAGLVVFLSWLLSELGMTAVHPKDGSIIEPRDRNFNRIFCHPFDCLNA